MLTPAMFRHELIRVIKGALPKDKQTPLTRFQVEQVQLKLSEKTSAAWKLSDPARFRQVGIECLRKQGVERQRAEKRRRETKRSGAVLRKR